MKKEKSFRTIVFFGIVSEKSFEIKKYFSSLDFIKVFLTNNLDEVEQIVSMSLKTALITDTRSMLELATKKKMLGSHRLYHMDWQNMLDQRDMSELLLKKVTTINVFDLDLIVEKIELYLFGRVNVFKQGIYFERESDPSTRLQNFFTLLELHEGIWKVIVSSHERSENISEVIGKNWDTFLSETLVKADLIKSMEEVKLAGNTYYEVVSPVIKDEKTQKICILHLNIRENSEENIKKAKLFLASFTTSK